MRKRRLVPKKKKKEVQKYREKTLQEHAADGLVMILKKIGEEDNKLYHAMRTPSGDTSKDVNEFSVIGTEEKMKVNGRAKIGYFDVVDNGRHFVDREITYNFEASVRKDNWGQKLIVIEEFEVYGIDDLQGSTVMA